MTNNLKYILISLIPLAFIGGLFAGKIIFKRSVTRASAATATTPNQYPYLNPLLDDIHSMHLNMAELKSFRPKLNAYIEVARAKDPDLHISYYFRDLNNGMWLGINEQDAFSPASLMKVPLMVSVLKEAEQNPQLLETKILFEKEKYQTLDEESGFEKTDKQFYTVNELLAQSIQYSDNAASLMLMQFIGMHKVIKAEEDLNLSVDAKEDFYSNFVKVKSYAGSLRILYNSSYLSRGMSEKALELMEGSKYREGLKKSIPAGVRIAHKYGERDIFEPGGKRKTLQLHHFGIVYYPGKPFLVGIMTRGGSKEAKVKAVEELGRITYEEVDKQVKSNGAKIVNVEY